MPKFTRKPATRSSRLVALAFPLVAGFAGGAYVMAKIGPAEPPKAQPAVSNPAPPPDAVTALGRVEPDRGVLTVGIPAPDQIEALKVEEDQRVKAGDVLAELASRSDRRMECELARRQLAEARARLEQMKKSGAAQVAAERLSLRQAERKDRLELENQKVKVEKIRRQKENAEETLRRMQDLPRSSVSQQDLDQQKLLVEQDRIDFRRATAVQAEMEDSQKLNQEAARAELEALEAKLAMQAAEVPVDSLEQKVKLADRLLERTLIRAPSDGVILKILARRGELVGGSQPLLRMAETGQMAVIAEVYETDVARVMLGQAATVKGHSLKDAKGNEKELHGRVVQVGVTVGKNQTYPADPTQEVDRRITEVRILLDKDSAQAAARRIGAQVNVTIQAGAPGKQ